MDITPSTAVFQLTLHDTGLTLAAPADQTLLRTLQQAGVDWPASCRNGTCRRCIGQLVAGTVGYRVEWPGLLPEEKLGGAVLPCVAEPRSDLTLAPPAPD